LSIDDDVLFAAKEIARAEGRTTGQVLSEAFRQWVGSSAVQDEVNQRDRALAELGIRRLPKRGGLVTNEEVNRIREELGI